MKREEFFSIFTGIVVFGSIWGLLESTVGDFLKDRGYPSGVIMTAIFGFGIMVLTRKIYGVRGMQLGMGLLAGTLRYFNPVGSCVLCSSIAIMAEGMLFEFLYINPALQFSALKGQKEIVGMGIISGYLIYFLAYLTTQILTPFVTTGSVMAEDFFATVPLGLARATAAGLLGGVTLPVILAVRTLDISAVKKDIYYPAAYIISGLCWIVIALI